MCLGEKVSAGKKINKKSTPLFSTQLLFSIKFFSIFLILTYIFDSINISILTNSIAYVCAILFGAAYYQNVIFVGEKTFIITNMCTGLTTVAILASAIFSMKYPKIKKKIVLFVFGSALIFLVNIPRILLILFSQQIGFDADLMHTITWFLMSALVLVIILLGSKFYYKKELFDIV
jgi:exosortase/archaeosortase family protein